MTKKKSAANKEVIGWRELILAVSLAMALVN